MLRDELMEQEHPSDDDADEKRRRRHVSVKASGRLETTRCLTVRTERAPVWLPAKSEIATDRNRSTSPVVARCATH
jgi:hypothetical protein